MVLLVTFVLNECFGDARMSAGTFLDRIATLPAKLHIKVEPPPKPRHPPPPGSRVGTGDRFKR